MFNYAMSLAAFGFVAFVLVFVHPASLASRAAARQATAGSKVSTAQVAAANVPSRPVASK